MTIDPYRSHPHNNHPKTNTFTLGRWHIATIFSSLYAHPPNQQNVMPPTRYVHDHGSDDDEETISICSSVVSEETLEFVPSRQLVRKPVRRCGGLTRSDGRESVLAPSSPSRQSVSADMATLSSGMLLSSPRARELRRRRPVNNSSSSSYKPSFRAPLVSGDDDDDSSSSSSDDELVIVAPDQAPACPRRANSSDRDSWPNLIPSS